MDPKQTLRRQAEIARRGRGQVDLAPALAHVLAAAHRVACHMPFGDEPAVAPRPGWLLPVLLPDNDLDWAVYDGALAPGRRGVLEPVGPRLGVEAISSCDVVLVPALLVDRHGNRLGKGGGSYDRALRRATGLTIALLHDGELVDDVPHSQHDVPVKAVASLRDGLVMLPQQPSGRM